MQPPLIPLVNRGLQLDHPTGFNTVKVVQVDRASVSTDGSIPLLHQHLVRVPVVIQQVKHFGLNVAFPSVNELGNATIEVLVALEDSSGYSSATYRLNVLGLNKGLAQK